MFSDGTRCSEKKERMQRETKHSVRRNDEMSWRFSRRPLLYRSMTFTWSWWCSNSLWTTAQEVTSLHSLGTTHKIKSKNLWHSKCVRRAIFQNVEYFLFHNIKKKKKLFSVKIVKNCFGCTFDYFIGKGDDLP